jgi:hypothetical protein
VFWLIGMFITGFSSILAYAFTLAGGTGGIAGWSWIFVSTRSNTLTPSNRLTHLAQIIEGAITIFLGIMTFIFVPDYPEKSKFLTPEETKFILKRIDDDRGDALPDNMTLKKVLTHCGDWTVWAYGWPFTCYDRFR